MHHAGNYGTFYNFRKMKMSCAVVCLLVLLTASLCNSQQQRSCQFDELYCSLQGEIFSSATVDFLRVIFPDDRLSPRSFEIRTTMTIYFQVNSTQCSGNNIKGIVSLGAATSNQNSTGVTITDTIITSKTWHWAHRWSDSLLLQLVLKEDLWRKVGLTHSLTSLLLIANTGSFRISSTTSNIPLIYFNLRFFMPCTPNEEMTKSTWGYVLQWIKAYAVELTYDGFQPDGADVGYVQFYSDGWQGIEGRGTKYVVYLDNKTSTLYTLILVMQIILNITIASIAIKLVPFDVIRCSNKSPTAPFKLWDPLSAATSLYWSFVLSAVFVFLSAQLLAVSEQVSAYHANIYEQLLPLKVMVQVVYILALSAELVYAIYRSKDVKDLYIVGPVRYVLGAICCNCFHRSKLHMRTAAAVSMWIIMLFMLWSVDAIVSMTITAIVYPYAVFFTLFLFLSSWLFLIVFFAIIRHNTHLIFTNHSSFIAAVQRVGSIILVTMLFGLIVIIFWFLQYDNVQVRSITGFVVTAAPSVFLSVAAWFMKKRFLKDFEEKEGEEQEGEENGENTDVNMSNEDTTLKELKEVVTEVL